MRLGGCSPISRSRSLTARTRSRGSRGPSRPGGIDAHHVAVLDKIDADHLPAVRAAAAVARERAWAAGAGPDLDAPGGELCLDFDATITIAHSEKENAAATWKRTFGFHPLLCCLDRPTSPLAKHLPACFVPGTLVRTPPRTTASRRHETPRLEPASIRRQGRDRRERAPPHAHDGQYVTARAG